MVVVAAVMVVVVVVMVMVVAVVVVVVLLKVYQLFLCALQITTAVSCQPMWKTAGRHVFT